MGSPRQLPELTVVVSLIRQGRSATEVGRDYGTSASAVYGLLRYNHIRIADIRPDLPGGATQRSQLRKPGPWLPPPEWADRATCADRGAVPDPDIFHPTKGDLASVRAARRICRGCEVRPECLAWALEHRIPDGIYAGTTPRQRQERRRAERDQEVTA